MNNTHFQSVCSLFFVNWHTGAIYYYCPDAAKYNVEVKAQFFQGTVRDACLLDIYIDNTKSLGVLVT